jgi:hypothetical protein
LRKVPAVLILLPFRLFAVGLQIICQRLRQTIRVVFDSLNPDYEIGDDATKSAEGAAREPPMVPRLQRSIASQAYPGLTAGPIAFRPFGPYCHMSIHL